MTLINHPLWFLWGPLGSHSFPTYRTLRLWYLGLARLSRICGLAHVAVLAVAGRPAVAGWPAVAGLAELAHLRGSCGPRADSRRPQAGQKLARCSTWLGSDCFGEDPL